MNIDLPSFELDRYESIINKNINWLSSNLDANYIHIHSNGNIENKEDYLKNISIDEIKFTDMNPKKWKIREESNLIFITGISNFKLFYFKEFLDLNLAYHFIWKKDLKLNYIYGKRQK